MKDFTFSIVIPTYKRLLGAIETVKIVRKFHQNAEIILVDQCDLTPPSHETINNLGIKYFNLDEGNLSVARNKGIQEARGEIIFFLDDDLEITKDTIKEQLKTYEDESVVGTVGRVLNDGEKIPNDTNVETGHTNFLGTTFSFRFWSTKKQFVDFPYGCNMSFRRDILQKVGGFDKHYSKIFDEVDLGRRISNKLGKIAFVPEALAYHHKATSGGTRTSGKNRQIMVYSYYGYYLAKNVHLPFSLVSLLLRTRTVLFEAPYALMSFYKGYLRFFLRSNT